MTASALAAELTRLGVLLTAEGADLVARGPKGWRTPELLAAMREHKATLLAAAAGLKPPLHARFTCAGCGWASWSGTDTPAGRLCGACAAGKPPRKKPQEAALHG